MAHSPKPFRFSLREELKTGDNRVSRDGDFALGNGIVIFFDGNFELKGER